MNHYAVYTALLLYLFRNVGDNYISSIVASDCTRKFAMDMAGWNDDSFKPKTHKTRFRASDKIKTSMYQNRSCEEAMKAVLWKMTVTTKSYFGTLWPREFPNFSRKLGIFRWISWSTNGSAPVYQAEREHNASLNNGSSSSVKDPSPGNSDSTFPSTSSCRQSSSNMHGNTYSYTECVTFSKSVGLGQEGAVAEVGTRNIDDSAVSVWPNKFPEYDFLKEKIVTIENHLKDLKTEGSMELHGNESFCLLSATLFLVLIAIVYRCISKVSTENARRQSVEDEMLSDAIGEALAKKMAALNDMVSALRRMAVQVEQKFQQHYAVLDEMIERAERIKHSTYEKYADMVNVKSYVDDVITEYSERTDKVANEVFSGFQQFERKIAKLDESANKIFQMRNEELSILYSVNNLRDELRDSQTATGDA